MHMLIPPGAYNCIGNAMQIPPGAYNGMCGGGGSLAGGGMTVCVIGSGGVNGGVGMGHRSASHADLIHQCARACFWKTIATLA